MSMARGQIKILSSQQPVVLMGVMQSLKPERVVVREWDICEETRFEERWFEERK